jgi:hypothetical protein
MEKMIAYCGLECHRCDTFLATKNNDGEKRAAVIQRWFKYTSELIKPEDVNCDGCFSNNGKLFPYCQTCDIKTCGMEKNVVNCAYCPEYPCEKLEQFFHVVPESPKRLKAQNRLDKIREDLKIKKEVGKNGKIY